MHRCRISCCRYCFPSLSRQHLNRCDCSHTADGQHTSKTFHSCSHTYPAMCSQALQPPQCAEQVQACGLHLPGDNARHSSAKITSQRCVLRNQAAHHTMCCLETQRTRTGEYHKLNKCVYVQRGPHFSFVWTNNVNRMPEHAGQSDVAHTGTHTCGC